MSTHDLVETLDRELVRNSLLPPGNIVLPGLAPDLLVLDFRASTPYDADDGGYLKHRVTGRARWPARYPLPRGGLSGVGSPVPTPLRIR